MRLDALNWNIKWQQNAVCTCPLLSSAIHFIKHEDEAGCPGFKSIWGLLLPPFSQISQWLLLPLLANDYQGPHTDIAKLFVENDKCWALVRLKKQCSQPGGWRWLSFAQCKMGRSLRVTLCQLWNNMENRALVHILTSCNSLSKASWTFWLCRTTSLWKWPWECQS